MFLLNIILFIYQAEMYELWHITDGCQTAHVSYFPDGTATTHDVADTTRATMTVLDRKMNLRYNFGDFFIFA